MRILVVGINSHPEFTFNAISGLSLFIIYTHCKHVATDRIMLMNKCVFVQEYAGHPFQVRLGREPARNGYNMLHLYFGHNNTPKGDLEKRTSDPGTFSVESIYSKEPIRKYSYLKRWFQEMVYRNLMAACIKAFKPDFLFSANILFDYQKMMLRAYSQAGTKFIRFCISD